MIIAGIDEAGYGPLLGPLVVGCCAFDVDVQMDPGSGRPATSSSEAAVEEEGGVATAVAVDVAEKLPCVWSRLRRHVSRNRSKTGKKIHINDSKQVYSPSIGLKELERAVLALVAARGNWPETLDHLLGQVAPHAPAELAEHPWYAPAGEERFPCEQDALPIRLFAKALHEEMQTKRARCVHLAARIMSERPFNRMVSATRNKASVLFTQAGHHLDYLVRTFADDGLTIFCDRQGGRSSYGHLLRMMFEDWALEILEQSDGWSEYLLRRGTSTVRILFAEKAEAQCLPVAVASMLSKYFRETLMRRFNAYWKHHAPDVEPTAGYHPDGVRFVEQIDVVRKTMGIKDEELIRIK